MFGWLFSRKDKCEHDWQTVRRDFAYSRHKSGTSLYEDRVCLKCGECDKSLTEDKKKTGKD